MRPLLLLWLDCLPEGKHILVKSYVDTSTGLASVVEVSQLFPFDVVLRRFSNFIIHKYESKMEIKSLSDTFKNNLLPS